jgi:hypothetical protein
VIKKSLLVQCALACAAVGAAAIFASPAAAQDGHFDHHFQFVPDTLVLSRSVYAGNASTVTVGQVLPPNCVPGNFTVALIAGGTATVNVPAANSSGCNTAVADGTYPGVFENDNADGSFGVTSPIFLDNITTDGQVLGTLSVPDDLLVTSFSSKSELAVHRSLDGRSFTIVGYHGGSGFLTAPNQLDVSNSNTPGVVDPSNPVVSQYYRSVLEVDAHGRLTLTEGNAYSGNNGRAAIKANSVYYLAGNDNNGGLSKSQLGTTVIGEELVNSTGVELLVPGQAAPLPPNIDMIGDFSVTQVGYSTADKLGKDNNFRGLAIFNNTLYTTKGSGSNGINTVYQVGTAGTLPTGDEPGLLSVPITIPAGFPTVEASGDALNGTKNNPVAYPFGLWFANASTLYVCDEGDGTLVTPAVNGNVATTLAQTTAGVQKWTLSSSGTWQLAYVLNSGLEIGVPYTVGTYPSPATDGCRHITGRVNGDGTVSLYITTSTVSTAGDQGADPNKLETVTDVLSATSLPLKGWDRDGAPLGKFITLRTARFGEVLRGIDWAPTDNGPGGEHRW